MKTTILIIVVVTILLIIIAGEFVIDSYELKDKDKMCKMFRDVCDRDCDECRWGDERPD